MFVVSLAATSHPLAGSGALSMTGLPSLTLYRMVPLLPKYSFRVEYTLVCVPLSAATSARYLRMMLEYEVLSVWPAGVQKMGVTTSGPVCLVPMTGPPWYSRGGVPTAGSLVALPGIVAVDEVAHPVVAETARVTPRSLADSPVGDAQLDVAWVAVLVSVAAAPAALTVAPVRSAVAEAARTAITLPLLRIRGFTGNPSRSCRRQGLRTTGARVHPTIGGVHGTGNGPPGAGRCQRVAGLPQGDDGGCPRLRVWHDGEPSRSSGDDLDGSGVGQAPVSVRPRRRGA